MHTTRTCGHTIHTHTQPRRVLNMIVYRARVTRGSTEATVTIQRTHYSQILEWVQELYDWCDVDAVELELVKDDRHA